MKNFFAEIDLPPPKRQFCGGSQQAVEKMIQYGRELRAMCEQLKRQFGLNEANEKALKVCSVIAVILQLLLSWFTFR